MTNYTQLLSNDTKNILFEEDYSKIVAGINGLIEIFSELSGVTLGDINDQDIMLSTGKAVSPTKAAYCLREFERTRRFLRGINKAITHLLEENPGKRVNILYAGCGPYATLITPLTSLYTDKQISVTLLDIHEISLLAAEKLYKGLGIMSYIKRLVLEDATIYRVDELDDFDLMISETMLNALINEPQVAIMANLIPQLKQGGIFIPQEIKIDLALLNPSEEHASFFVDGKLPHRVQLATIYTAKVPFQLPVPVTIPIPQITTHRQLSLLTEICTYGDEVLSRYASSLTLPYKLATLDTETEYESIGLNYIINDKPHFEFSIKKAEPAF